MKKNTLIAMVMISLSEALTLSGCKIGISGEDLRATQAAAIAETTVAQKATLTALEQAQAALAATQTAMSFTMNTPTPMPTLCVIGESGDFCTDNGSGGTEIIPVEPPRIVAQIRIDLKKRATGYGFSLREVEAYGPGAEDTNLAKDGGVKASSTQDDEACPGCFAAYKAVDGDINSRWSSDFLDRQSFEITLPGLQVVNRIVLIWETAYAREYCVTVIEP